MVTHVSKYVKVLLVEVERRSFVSVSPFVPSEIG